MVQNHKEKPVYKTWKARPSRTHRDTKNTPDEAISSLKSRKERILESALHIFAEKGFQNTTISEISKNAGVSEATIYEYFGTKEELFFAIPEKISTESRKETNSILPHIPGAEGRIRYIVHGYCNQYQTMPDYSALVLLALMSNKKFRQTNAHAAIRAMAHDLLNCIREGIQDGTFKKDLNPYLIRSILMGTMEHVFIHWHMQGRPPDANIMEMVDQFIEIVLKGIRAEKEDTGITIQLKLENAQGLRDLLHLQENLKNKNQPEK